MSFILGEGIVVEVEEVLPTPIDVDAPAVVEALGPPEIDFPIEVVEPPTIEMDSPDFSVLVLPVAGPAGPAGADGQDGEGVITGICGEVLSGHRVVVGTDVLLYAEPGRLSHAGITMYLTLQAGLLGDEIEIVPHGRVVEPSWSWSPGRALYLTDGGRLSQTVPSDIAFLRTMGWAETSTQIYFFPQLAIALISPTEYGSYGGGYGPVGEPAMYGYGAGYGLQVGPEYGTYGAGYGAAATAGRYGSYAGGYVVEEPEEDHELVGGYAAGY